MVKIIWHGHACFELRGIRSTILFDPFTGPIYDNEGTLRIESGRRGTHDELWTINWYVDNILGKVPT